MDKLTALTRQHEELTGPVLLYANTEVREAMQEVSDAYVTFAEEAVGRRDAGQEPAAAVSAAWGIIMRRPQERLEDAMRRQVGLDA